MRTIGTACHVQSVTTCDTGKTMIFVDLFSSICPQHSSQLFMRYFDCPFANRLPSHPFGDVVMWQPSPVLKPRPTQPQTSSEFMQLLDCIRDQVCYLCIRPSLRFQTGPYRVHIYAHYSKNLPFLPYPVHCPPCNSGLKTLCLVIPTRTRPCPVCVSGLKTRPTGHEPDTRCPVSDVPIMRLFINRARFVVYSPFVRLPYNHLQTACFSGLIQQPLKPGFSGICPLFYLLSDAGVFDVIDAKIAHFPQRFFPWPNQFLIHGPPTLLFGPFLLQEKNSSFQSTD